MVIRARPELSMRKEKLTQIINIDRSGLFFELLAAHLCETFPCAGKSGETPDTRAEWTLQTMNRKSAPADSLEMQSWLMLALKNRQFEVGYKTCDVTRKERSRWSEKQVFLNRKTNQNNQITCCHPNLGHR